MARIAGIDIPRNKKVSYSGDGWRGGIDEPGWLREEK